VTMVCKCEIEKRLGGAWRGEGVSGCHVWRMKTQKLKESQHTSALASCGYGPLHDTKGNTRAGQLALKGTDVHRHQEERSGGATWAAEELGQMAVVCDDFKMMNRKNIHWDVQSQTTHHHRRRVPLPLSPQRHVGRRVCAWLRWLRGRLRDPRRHQPSTSLLLSISARA
jgi:hypothetical protein